MKAEEYLQINYRLKESLRYDERSSSLITEFIMNAFVNIPQWLTSGEFLGSSYRNRVTRHCDELIEIGYMEERIYKTKGTKTRKKYRLTEKGIDFVNNILGNRLIL